MEIIGMIVIGFIVGALARLVKPGRDSMGFIFTTLLGIAGAVVGGFMGRMMGIYQFGEPAGWIASILGAVVLLLLVQGLFRNRRMA